MTAPTTAMDGLLVSAARLDALTDRARQAVAAGHMEAAAAWVQTAATFAWMNHCGLFASGPLEQLLGEIAARTTPSAGAPRPARGEVRRVLHVATQLYATGGHTQALRCWVDQDAGRQHRLVVTRQGPAPIPTKIAEALPDRDQILLLDRQPGALLRRAGRLREAAEWADLVILHTHNNDVVPTLALSAAPWLPPSIQVDSNDHTFWIGRTGASLVMHMRESGRELAGRRRGLAPADSFVLERPLRFRTRTATRAEAKRSLGLDPDQVVIATAADPTKYRPVSAVSFLDLLVPVLQERCDAVLVAAGPTADGVWGEAAAATGGRVRALGLIPDASRLHEATDIYVDSFPFASLTSLLESGSLGNPTVTFRGHPAGCEVLGADTRGLDDLMLTPRTPTEFCATVTDLIDDERRRADLGRRTAEQIVATHTGPRWLKEAQLMYAEAQARPGRIVPSQPYSQTCELDRLVALVMERTGLATGVRGALTGNAGLLPARDRLRVLQEQRPRLNRSLARWVLSEWQQTVAVRSRRRLQTWVR